jgi:hypothetical protein
MPDSYSKIIEYEVWYEEDIDDEIFTYSCIILSRPQPVWGGGAANLFIIRWNIFKSQINIFQLHNASFEKTDGFSQEFVKNRL